MNIEDFLIKQDEISLEIKTCEERLRQLDQELDGRRHASFDYRRRKNIEKNIYWGIVTAGAIGVFLRIIGETGEIVNFLFTIGFAAIPIALYVVFIRKEDPEAYNEEIEHHLRCERHRAEEEIKDDIRSYKENLDFYKKKLDDLERDYR
tara:strand:- start:110 stop:556 length:447 start_codon:yes stop_codon:yes gene_type:complete